MRVAVTYDNGEIFQHFGHSEAFKIYDIEDGKVASSQVITTSAQGHDAMADLLQEFAVNAVICGGIGGGAQAALQDCGILLFPDVSGSADEAVEAWLRGELQPGEANCDHHAEGCCEGGCSGSCGDAEEGCEGGCGSESGCRGGCPGHCGRFTMEGRNVGKVCSVHYKGTLNDGTQFDSSYDRGEPLEFVCGAGMMIRGFDQAVADMEVGTSVQIHLMPEEAYGPADPRAIFTVEISQLPGAENLSAGQQVYLSSPGGQPFPVRVAAKDEATITFDANHEMAGKELNFFIELVEVK